MTNRARGEVRIFTRKGSAFLWCAYYLRGKEYRESTGETDRQKAERFLKRRLKEVGADQIGKGIFIGPQQERIKVSQLLDATAPQIRHLSEKGNARQGFFADADFHALTANLPRYLQDFVRFGYLTGWRKGEIASLRWEDVDGDVIRLRAENAKNGEARSVTLGGELGELIEGRKAERQVKTAGGVLLAAFVFHLKGEPIGDFRKAWATACVASGLGRFVCERCNQTVSGHWCEGCKCVTRYSGRIFHDFRRTAVRNMVRAGVSERVAMTISGHRTRSIFDRYNIVNEADLREAMQRTQNYLREVGQQSVVVRMRHS